MVENVSLLPFRMGRKCFLWILKPLNPLRISALRAEIEQIRSIRQIVPQELVIKKHISLRDD